MIESIETTMKRNNNASFNLFLSKNPRSYEVTFISSIINSTCWVEIPLNMYGKAIFSYQTDAEECLYWMKTTRDNYLSADLPFTLFVNETINILLLNTFSFKKTLIETNLFHSMGV